MLTEVNPAVPRRQTALLSLSLGVHFLLLAFVLHSPAPIFVAPTSVTKGEGGVSLRHIYFGGRSGVTQERPAYSVFLPRPAHPQIAPHLAPLPAKMQRGNETIASAQSTGPSAGSPYGSLSYGAVFGLEVRPALPVISADPVVGSDLLNGTTGDVIVEITIDELGNVVETKVLQSLGPPVDERVLAAVEKWHFSPATRNGVPIPSKQDVHYHFPR